MIEIIFIVKNIRTVHTVESKMTPLSPSKRFSLSVRIILCFELIILIKRKRAKIKTKLCPFKKLILIAVVKEQHIISHTCR